MIFFRKKIVSLFFISFCFSFLSFSAKAEDGVQTQMIQASNWEQTQGGRVRVVLSNDMLPLKDESQLDTKKQTSTQQEPLVVYKGVIEVELDNGWKTYWRNPGPSGMAPSFHFTQDVRYKLFFPAPTLIESQDDWSFGYYGRVLIPFEVAMLSSESELSGALTIGLCKTICMPIDVNFSFDLRQQAPKTNNVELENIFKQASAEKPKLASDDFKVTNIIENDNALLVTLHHPMQDNAPEFFVDGGVTELGIAKIKEQKADETVYQVPIIYRSSRWDKTVFYIAKTAHEAISGEAHLN